MRKSLIEIANYQFSSEAYLFKGKLESEGIEVFLQNENTINTDPLLSNALGGVKLFVNSEDVQQSKQILDAIPEYSLDDKGELLSCQNCGSQKITMVTTIKDIKSFLAFIYGLLTLSMPLFSKQKYKCENCNFEF
jgi:DNA-directed RNA polymerase subunit RPC12/RpoP